MKDTVQITRELVQIDSTNPGAGEKEVVEYIQAFLADKDAVVELSEIEPDRYNIIATLPASESESECKQPMLILICHMDTVVTGNEWSRDPFGAEVQDSRIYGRGACDMKAGLACALSVFCKTADEIKEEKKRLKHALRLICTADEEGFMAGVENVINKGYVKKNDWVLDLEPTDGQIQMAHKGRFWIELEVRGITAHASRPEQGADAIAAAAEVICEMKSRFDVLPFHSQLGRSTITFGQIQGGYQPYVVPDECRVWMDCRLAPPVDDKKVLDLLHDACNHAAKKIPGTHIEYQITGNRPYIEKNASSFLLKHLKAAVNEAEGQMLDAEVFPGYTDTAVIAGKLGNVECMSYGPGSLKNAHKPDEFVEIADIRRCERVLELLIQTLIL